MDYTEQGWNKTGLYDVVWMWHITDRMDLKWCCSILDVIGTGVFPFYFKFCHSSSQQHFCFSTLAYSRTCQPLLPCLHMVPFSLPIWHANHCAHISSWFTLAYQSHTLVPVPIYLLMVHFSLPVPHASPCSHISAWFILAYQSHTLVPVPISPHGSF